jgi:hypothetical protein
MFGVNTCFRMSSSALLFSALIFSSSLLQANITALNVINTSAADDISPTGTGRHGEFATQSTLGSVSIAGDTASFTHQMQFYNGYYIGPDGPTAALTHSRNVSYDLSFTVLDPTNIGYTLEIDTLMRGYSTAMWTSGTSPNAVTVANTTFSGRIDTDTSDGTDTLGTQVGSLTFGVSGATANSTDTSVNTLGESTGQYNSSGFSGTRSFALRFTTFGSGETNIFLQNNQQGQGSIRFGLENGDSILDLSGQPGGDAWSSNDLGHFVTVNAVFAEAIPEPASIAYILCTVALAGLIRRRRPAA